MQKIYIIQLMDKQKKKEHSYIDYSASLVAAINVWMTATVTY